MSPIRPQLSDDDLLAVICRLGANMEVGSIQRALNARLNAEVDPGYCEERLQRLRRAGLVRFFQVRATDQRQIRLTAAGVERLQSLQREPVKPATD